jgi:hypothetical protein
VPTIDCDEDMAGQFYYTGWNNECNGYIRPTRHWCVIAEIVAYPVSPIRPAALVRTQWKEEFVIWFYHQSVPEYPQNPTTFSWADLKPGNTIAIMYGEQKRMADYSLGIRHEYLGTIYVFHTDLKSVFSASKVMYPVCSTCGKEAAQLSLCKICKTSKFCSEACYQAHPPICHQMEILVALCNVVKQPFQNPRITFNNIVARSISQPDQMKGWGISKAGEQKKQGKIEVSLPSTQKPLEDAIRLVMRYLRSATEPITLSTLAQNCSAASGIIKQAYGKKSCWRKFIEAHPNLFSITGTPETGYEVFLKLENAISEPVVTTSKQREKRKARKKAAKLNSVDGKVPEGKTSHGRVPTCTQLNNTQRGGKTPGHREAKPKGVPPTTPPCVPQVQGCAEEVSGMVDQPVISIIQQPAPFLDETEEKDNRAHKNWLRMWGYLKNAERQLRLCFTNRWSKLGLGAWCKISSPKKFQERFPDYTKKLSFPDQKERVAAGNPELWDVSILCLLLCELDWGDANSPEENNSIRKIKEIRNSVAHRSFIPELEFKECSEELKALLVGIGMLEELWSDIEVLDFIQYFLQPVAET